MNDTHYMMIALEEAKKAEQMAEVPVGAVLVDSMDKIIGKGHNQPIHSHDPTEHAEIKAIRMAAAALKNYRLIQTTLYVTIEPCIMCMGAIIHARISRLVYGAADPKGGAVTSLYSMANDSRLNHKLDVTAGICKDSAQQLIKDFFAAKRKKP